jgi:hypothetical protein
MSGDSSFTCRGRWSPKVKNGTKNSVGVPPGAADWTATKWSSYTLTGLRTRDPKGVSSCTVVGGGFICASQRGFVKAKHLNHHMHELRFALASFVSAGESLLNDA